MHAAKQDRVLIGERLRAARERAHIPLDEAARAANVQPLAVEKWERGASLPSLLEFRPLLELYGVMACQVLFEGNPIELTHDQAAELTRQARSFTPDLRAKVDLLMTVLSRAKEPVWKRAA